MNTTNNVHHALTGHTTRVELGEELISETGAGLRIAELGVVVLFGLLLCPPLLILVVVVAAPLIAITLLVAAVVVAIAVPMFLVRRVRAHHHAHGSTMFLHHLRP